jgi:hypothetical protein
MSPNSSELEIVIENFKRYKSLDIDQIASELTQAGSKTLCSANLLILSEIRKHCYNSGRNLLGLLYLGFIQSDSKVPLHM